MKIRLTSTMFALAALCFASQLQASEIEFLGMGLHRSVDYRHNGNHSAQAGELLIEFGGDPYTAYCVDLDNAIKDTWDADFEPVSFINGGIQVAYLYDMFASLVSTNTEAAGLQVAIWEVVQDFGGALDLSHGDFKLTSPSSVRTAAQGFLDALPADLSGYSTSSYILAAGGDRCQESQHLIVPEPATLVMLGLGLPLFLIGRRKAATA